VGNLDNARVQNVFGNLTAKEFSKAVYSCRSYYQKSCIVFFETQCILQNCSVTVVTRHCQPHHRSVTVNSGRSLTTAEWGATACAASSRADRLTAKYCGCWLVIRMMVGMVIMITVLSSPVLSLLLIYECLAFGCLHGLLTGPFLLNKSVLFF